jgi:1,4-dihydroxy-2-naphthoate octaprenyltransferase
MKTTPELILKKISGLKKMTLAAFSERLWQSEAVVMKSGEEIYCSLADALVRREISKNPRISFIGKAGSTQVRGHAIARVPADIPEGVSAKLRDNIFLIQPYRIIISEKRASDTVIEKLKPGWQIVMPETAFRTSRGLKFWMSAARIISAPLSIVPVLTGTIIAAINGPLHILRFLAALAGGVAAHMGVNLYSDYNDFKKGFDTPGALSSHTGVLTRELVSPASVLSASFFCFLITIASGVYLISACGWPVIIFGLAGVVAGASYTGGPLALKYRALGELTTAFFMGPLMVAGAYFVQAGHLAAEPVIISLSLGLLVGSVTLANNIRDMVDDSKNGFVTMPIKIGFEAARKNYYFFLIIPYAVVLLFIALWPGYYPAAAVFLTMPYMIKCINDIKSGGKNSAQIRISAISRPYPLNSIRLYTRFSALLLAGLLASLLFIHR